MVKKAFLFFSICLTTLIVKGQTNLTSANMNPIAGDVFIEHLCDTTGVLSGPSGAAVTWDFSALNTLSIDTINFMDCASTPFCDSFTGSNIAYLNLGNYTYEDATGSALSTVGSYFGGFYLYLNQPQCILFYPATYHSSHQDTFSAQVTLGSGYSQYLTGTDSFYCDAYGTLILPSGSYPNVLRVYHVNIVKDSIAYMGVSFSVSTSRTESYSWYDTGFHYSLLSIGYDTAGSTSSYVSGVGYYTIPPPLSNATLSTSETPLTIYPEPATTYLNLDVHIDNAEGAYVTVSDLLGHIVKTIPSTQIRQGFNDINIRITDLNDGVYIVSVHTAFGDTKQKAVIAR